MLLSPIQFLSIAAKSLIGGVVGYFTNDLAIQMLFKKKFGIGGVVARTRSEFIENATDLVEEDVLTTKALQEEMKQEGFRKALSCVIDDFVHRHLPAAIPAELSFGDLKGAEKSYDRLAEILLECIEPSITEIVGTLVTEVESDELISKEQASAIARKLSELILEILRTEPLFREFLRQLCDELGERKIAETVDGETIDRFAKAIAEPVSQCGKILAEHFDKDLDRLFQQLSELLRVDFLCVRIARSLTEKEWSERMGREGLERLISLFLQKSVELLESASGEALLRNLSHSLITVLKNTDHSLFDLIPDRLSVKFEGFIYLRLAALIRDVIRWVEERRFDIEEMINLSLADRSFVAKLIHSIGISLAEVFNVVDLVKEYIDGKIELDRLAEIMSREFVKLMKRSTLREILTKLEAEGALKQPSLTDAIRKSAVSALRHLRPSSLYPYLKRFGEEFFTRNRIEKLLNEAASVYLPRYVKRQFLYRERFWQTAGSTVSQAIGRLKSRKVGEVVGNRFFDHKGDKAQAVPFALPKSVRRAFERYLERFIGRSTEGKSIASLLESGGSTIHTALLEKAKKLAVEDKKKFLGLKLIPIYRKAAGKTVGHDLIAGIHRLLVTHLHILTKGSIKKISKNNLSSLSADQLCTVVENFVGNELKPITRFGAGLGLIAGAGLALLPDMQVLGARLGLPSSSVFLGLSALMFGCIGWGTNWLALKMIFRPYFAKRMLGMRIPLTPGVVSRNKARFARKMGQFVDDHLLQKNSIESMFLTNSQQIKSSIRNSVNRENFGVVDRQLNSQKSKLAKWLSEFATARFGSHNARFVSLIDSLLTRYQDRLPLGIPFKKLEEESDRIISQLFAGLKADIPSWLLQERVQKERLSEFLTPSLLAAFESYVAGKISNWIDLHGEKCATKEGLVRFIESFDGQFQRFADRSPLALTGTDRFGQIKTWLFARLIRLFDDADGKPAVVGYLWKILEREFHPDRRFEELYGGRLMNFTERSIDRLTHYLLRSALVYLRRNRQKIAENIYRTLLQESDFLTAQAVRMAKGELFDTIEDIVAVRLPLFFKVHESSLQALIRRQVSAIGGTRIGTVGTELDRGKVESLVDRSLSNRELLRFSSKFFGELLRVLMQERSRTYLDTVGINSIGSVAKIFEEELEIAQDTLRQVLVSHKEQLAAAPAPLVGKVLIHLASRTDLAQLRQGIPDSRLRDVLEALLRLLLESDSSFRFADRAYAEFIGRIKAGEPAELIEPEIFKRDVLRCADRLMAKRETRERVVSILSDLMQNILPRLNGALDIDTKNAVLDITINGLDRTLRSHIGSLLGTVDLKNIVVTRIDKMHPRKIERTFRKFAGRYFPKLIHYGFLFGLLFGLMMDAFYSASLYLLRWF